MSSTPEDLGEFITRRRHELGFSRDAVSVRARRAGFALSASYIAKLEAGVNPNTGRPPRPTIDKIDALAAGLGLIRDDLLAVMDGSKRSVWNSAEEFLVPDDITQSPTEGELEILRRVSRIDWGEIDPRKDGQFWYRDRTSRRRILRDLEDIFLELCAPQGCRDQAEEDRAG